MPRITPFLQQIANYYARLGAQNLVDICFVFPNKRSTTFFRRYLKLAVQSSKPWFEPEFIDIATFVGRFSPYTEASRYESIFTLYNCYREIVGPEAELPFDRFLFWGEMIVNDFNDVDRHLVDPDALFTNVERFKEIGSTYLTPEQIDIIKRYWGDTDSERLSADAKRFWTHLNDHNTSSSKRFRKLWQVLGPLYKAFHASLQERGLTTRGQLYRHAAAATKNLADYPQAPRKYVFVGFNVLTTSEIKIFRNLKALGRAHFFWDFNSPMLGTDANKAGRFIRKNMQEFAPPADFDEQPVTTYPKIDIIGVPSATGQAKVAGKVLEKWIDKGIASTDKDEISTAVVLPAEALFIPMIHSIPAKIKDMNLTMGFPMRLSPVSALTGNLWALQKNARRNEQGDVEGYFYEDVRNMLSLPIVQGLDPAAAATIIEVIKKQHLFMVPPATIANFSEPLAKIFIPINRNDPPAEIVGAIRQIIDFITQTAEAAADKLLTMFLESYTDALDTLEVAIGEFGITMDAFTLMHMINRAVRGDTAQFTGHPLKGLQIMGMLETRALDFRHIIVTSMNEGIFPRRQYTQSFIPDVLRRAYGMATTDFQESIFAYYFYRLISRAERVTLLYDSRTVGTIKSNEVSRYISQLLYLYPEAKASHYNTRFTQGVFSQTGTVIEKTQSVMKKLMRYADPSTPQFGLSASSLNTYINCPLLFYLQYVERFNPDDEINDYIDYSTYGSIVHDVMENIYKRLQTNEDEHVTITSDYIEELRKPSSPVIGQLLLAAINKHYHRIEEPKDFKPLVGETAVLAKVIHFNINNLLEHELELTPFTFIAAEKKIITSMEINPNLRVNIKQVIDRIDEVTHPEKSDEKQRRIVDYKTGIDNLSMSSLESLFDPDDAHRPKAIMQLLFYCLVYAHESGYGEAILPVIYKMRNLYANGFEPIKFGPPRQTKPIDDYRPFAEEFAERLRGLIEEIFNPAIPFAPATNDKACTFCNFKNLCSRAEE